MADRIPHFKKCVGLGFEEGLVLRDLPPLIHGVAVPEDGGEAVGILRPTTHGTPFEGHDAGDHGTIDVEEFPAIFTELGAPVDVVIDVGHPGLVEAGGLPGDTGHLGVEVVVEVALPRPEFAFVGGPDALERDGRCCRRRKRRRWLSIRR